MPNRGPIVILLGLGVVVAFSITVSTAAGAGAREVSWPALNPAFEGATFVRDDKTCTVCHENSSKSFSHTRHAQGLRDGGLAAASCESCHGPRSKHIQSPNRELAHENLSAAQQSAVCLQCHEGGSRLGWKGGAHASAEVSCSSCHYVMERRSEKALLTREKSLDTCTQCHADVGAKMQKVSHHPLREGRMDCTGCHDVHGSRGPSSLKQASVNETCFTCHADKRGPFVFEHAPARESCATCHEPHGSSHRGMLAAKEPFLCMTCHSYGGHINLPRYNRVSTLTGTGCTNCHTSVHGSNHPSGIGLTR